MVISFFKKQFIDVIEWSEPDDEILVFRYPMQDQEIQNGAQLTVRETQAALFVNEGKIADLFAPGLHTVSTRTLPLLTNLKNWDKLFASPFKSDLYFFSMRQKIDRKWGTPQPVTVRDREYGPLRIRAFANYSYSVADPANFFKKISGTREVYRADELEGQLRGVISASFASGFASAGLAFVDASANQLAFSTKLVDAMQPAFKDYGLKLESFALQSVTLPDDVTEKMDKASSMRILGNLGQYTQFQTAESIPAAAAASGGVAGAAAGMAAGMAMGQAMTGAMQQGATATGGGDVMKTIEQLHDLLKKGIITQAEFDSKKAELLGKIR